MFKTDKQLPFPIPAYKDRSSWHLPRTPILGRDQPKTFSAAAVLRGTTRSDTSSFVPSEVQCPPVAPTADTVSEVLFSGCFLWKYAD